mgnify:CR=1 FL=1
MATAVLLKCVKSMTFTANVIVAVIFAAKMQGVDLNQIKKEAKEFMVGKDGEKEFPHIRFTFEGKEI